jgi:DNA-binding XRE family transcriptional regulator
VRVRNNRLVTSREQLGLSQTAAAEAIVVSKSLLNSLETCRELALGKNGEWREAAVRIAEYYGQSVEWLWPDEVRVLKKRAATMFVDAADIGHALEARPDLLLQEKNEGDAIAKTLNGVLWQLSPRERNVLEQRFGEERTLEAIGKDYEVGRERIRSIEANALLKLRRVVKYNLKRCGSEFCRKTATRTRKVTLDVGDRTVRLCPACFDKPTLTLRSDAFVPVFDAEELSAP